MYFLIHLFRIEKETIYMRFLEHFKPELVITSPGRINLIGEHTDYNMGYVLPTAIDKKIIFSFQKNSSPNICNIYSKGYEKGFTIDLNKVEKSEKEWENYILGVVHEIQQLTTMVSGFNCLIESYLPMGSGVSSSAALECGLAFGLNTLFDLALSPIDMVQLSQKAEHTFVGTQCGIMDQFASVMSKKGHVIQLDCESLAYEYIPIKLGPYKLVLLNSNVAHSLASSEYNTRRAECEEGVRIINTKFPLITALRHTSLDELKTCKDLMSATIYKRCKYVIMENERVKIAVDALEQNNVELLGKLLYETHEGLSKTYEVSCPELDFLVDLAKEHTAVIGARLMGGGFGGCTLNIVHEKEVSTFIEVASKQYLAAFDIQLTAFEAIPSGGTSIVYQE